MGLLSTVTGVLDTLTGNKGREDTAYQMVNYAFSELTSGLNIEPRYSDAPRVGVRRLPPNIAGSYDPDRRRFDLDKSNVDAYLRGKSQVDELERRLQETKEPWRRKSYERQLELRRRYLERYERTIKGTTFHESTHALRYRLNPESSKKERSDPVRRRIEEGVADLVEAVFLGMSKEDLLRYVRGYAESLHIGMKEGLYEAQRLHLEAVEDLLSSQEQLGQLTGKKGRNYEEERRRIKEGIRGAEAMHGALHGYRLGLLAAVGMYDVPKEEKVAFAERLVKDPNPQHILGELESFALRGLELYREKSRRMAAEMVEGLGTKEEVEHFAQAVAEEDAKEAYTPRKAVSGHEGTISILISGILIGGLGSFLLFNQPVTSMFVGTTSPNFLAVLLVGFLILFAYVLLRIR